MPLLTMSSLSILILLFQSFEVLAQTPPNGTAPHFPAVLAFGDSILDTGNNNMLPSLAKCNFPPYGKDFIGHRPTGRFSNGKVPSDLLVSMLGIKELLPPYLSPKLSSEDLLTGVSFASGGSGYDQLTAKLASVIPMGFQLEMFKDYKRRLKGIAGEDRAARIIGKSLYVVCAGTNDVANTYFGTTLRRAHYDFPAYATFLVRSVSRFVEDLHHLGARKIGVVGLPPIGCLPSQRTVAGGIQRDCVTLYNQASKKYNYELTMELQRLHYKFPRTKIVYIDIFTKLLDLMQNPLDYGFAESSKGCCGTGEFEFSILCNSLTSNTCVDDSKFVFWDSFHPTQKAYEIMAKTIIQNDLPLLI